MLVEIAGADMFFQAISRTGKTVDSGVIHRKTQSGQTMRMQPEHARGGQVPVSMAWIAETAGNDR